MDNIEKNLKKEDLYQPTMADIIQPVLKHKFLVFFEALLNQKAKNALTANVANVKIDFVNKILSFDIHQTIQLELLNVVEELLKTMISMKIATDIGHDQEGNIVYGFWIFNHLEPIKHKFKLNYSKSGVATHKIKIRYKEISMK